MANKEHFVYEVFLLNCDPGKDDGHITTLGESLIECGTGREALDIMRFCERHGIMTCIVPYVWWSND